jgi:RNA polymerase sigma-70 factor (ECF subfamily)
MESTPASLLERVRRPADQEAWSRFVQLYTPLIFYWGRKCGLQAEDAADLTQDVFATLVQKLPEFNYDQHRSFRAWLRTVTLNRWRDRLKKIANRPLGGGEADLATLAMEDRLSALEEDEYRKHLVGRALAVMKSDFQPTSWQAFWEIGVLGRNVIEVAHELGLSPAAVYAAKARVLNRLRQELAGLLE